MEKYKDLLMDIVMEYGPILIGAILFLIIGLWIAKAIANAVGKLMIKRGVDSSLQPFLKSLVGAILKILVVISVMSTVGIQMTSFIAILGAAGLAIGMALSGTLQNFAGGVMLLIFKPFEVGHVIEAQGHTGKVTEIQIFNTILNTPDNKVIIIPNGGLANGSMVNYSKEETRRVDLTVGIGYGDDVDKARAVIQSMIDADSRILKDPGSMIAVSELADSSVNFAVRVWVNAADYWGVYFDMTENVYKTFPKEGLNIPYPQMDVHVHNT